MSKNAIPRVNVSTILYIEDDDAAAAVFRLAIEEANTGAQVDCVSDGDTALKYLRHTGEYAATEVPEIIFLDVNLPKINGWQVLAEIRRIEELQSIPVVVLTSSQRRADKERAYDLGAKRFITKPYSLVEFIADVGSAYRDLVAHRQAAQA
jgi:CheY-like chemotaxis protein